MENPDVYSLILAGGSGTRFWPASRRLRPKQLLPLGPAAPESLIKRTLARLSGLVPEDRVFVSTGQHLVEATQRELSHLPRSAFLAEPIAKNTAPCIAWAAHVVAELNPDAVLCVLPSDQHASDEDAFVKTMKVAVRSAHRGIMTTIGIVPTRAETGYGYIQRGAQTETGVFDVACFVEKPNLALAQSYVESGQYLWNAGIFVFRVRDMLQAFSSFMPQIKAALDALPPRQTTNESDYEKAVLDFFNSVPSVSIDYGIMEKVARLNVVAGAFGWSDLGSWQSAWELSEKDGRGNSVPSECLVIDGSDNLVQDISQSASGSRPLIALLGVSDLCVIKTDDALLIIPRERSQDVREIVESLKTQGRAELL